MNTPSQTQKTLVTYFQTLGLDSGESKLLLVLVEYGTLTVLELARKSGINRTTAYRLLEQLKKAGYVEEMVDEYRHLFKIVDVHKLELIVREKKKS